MAQIPGLTALTTVANGDLMLVTDASASNVAKQIDAQALFMPRTGGAGGRNMIVSTDYNVWDTSTHTNTILGGQSGTPNINGGAGVSASIRGRS